jgi:Ca2+-binding EF-hand superfamily protein
LFISDEQARSLAETASVDTTNHSVSFNEFLKLMAQQREIEPDEDTLLEMFR